MKYLGDFAPGTTAVVCRFNTHKADGTPITLAGSPVVSVYKNSTTQSTAGVTLTVDYDSVTGLHHVLIDTSADGTFYAAGADFDIVITTGTVDSISVIGSAVGSFSLNNRSALRPTVAGRTLDVSSGGEAGLDWANVGSPTTTVALSNTTVARSSAVTSCEEVTGNVGGSVGSVLGNVGGSVASVTAPVTTGTISANAVNASAIASDAVSEIQSGLATAAALAAVAGYIDTEIADIQSRLPATLVGGRMDASVGAMAANVLTASALASDAVSEIQSGLATSTAVDALLVLAKLAASGATGSVAVTDNGTTMTLNFKDTDGTTTLATVTWNKSTGARTRVS